MDFSPFAKVIGRDEKYLTVKEKPLSKILCLLGNLTGLVSFFTASLFLEILQIPFDFVKCVKKSAANGGLYHRV